MQGFQLSILLIFLTLGKSTSSSNELSEAESLRAIMKAWNLSSLSWQGDNPCDGWQRIGCDNNSRVTFLNLSNMGITGPIPEELGNLIHLTYLDLGNARNSSLPYNQISGGLSAVQPLTNLLHLNLSFNSLQLNAFPSVIFNLTKLISLRIDNNRIGGFLPKELASLRNLTYLYVGNNSLQGPIPIEYGGLTNLQELSMWNNDLHSPIPSEFGNLPNLILLNLHDCTLYGGLPEELGRLKKIQTM
ncbi:hypothetical protein KP509_1Z073000 [Ceratopteris richardii]|nr:hypothetical protein KP509_1Z073000 [Ceratopteris richardii]